MIAAASAAPAQIAPPDNNVEQPADQLTVIVTAAATTERVRFAGPGNVVRMQLQVLSETGEILFEVSSKGNVLDWTFQDSAGQRLSDGAYLCVVTVKSISGRLSQKAGAVTIAAQAVSLRPNKSAQLSAAQERVTGPIEDNSSLTIVEGAEPPAVTVLANNGNEGQMIRGRGALTFRIGNFFSGIDTEQMRLTEAGDLGIGTSAPNAKLDVAGTIRAQRFLVAKPKQTDSANMMTLGNMTQAPDAADSVQPLASGSGTQDRIAKWTDNSGTLGDSVITESAGNIGIGTPSPTQALEVSNGRIIASGSQTLAAPGGILEIATTLTNNNNAASGIRMRNTLNGNASTQQALDVAPTFAPSASISLARGFISTAFFAPPPGITITDAYGGNANTAYLNTSGAVTN